MSTLNFSNAAFDKFQAQLRCSVSENSLVWLLRDGIFGELTHSRPVWSQRLGYCDRLLFLPHGWLMYAISRALFAVPKPTRRPAKSHVLFLSTRSNHLIRSSETLFNQLELGSAQGWLAYPFSQTKLSPLVQQHVASLHNRWVREIRPSDIRIALRVESCISRLFPVESSRVIRQKVRLYALAYCGWKRFWNHQIGSETDFVLTTYEKSPLAKAMLSVASERNVPRRVHWAHGLPHNSQQATFASEMWCLTPPDVEFFSSVLPPCCTPVYKPSPEGLDLAEKIGRMRPSDIKSQRPVHFLYLGAGRDPLYKNSDQLADLKVIANAKNAFGAAIEWRFRPHPSNVHELLSAINGVGIENANISEGSLEDDLRWAHAVGSAFTSVMIDAELAGRTLFWVHSEIRPLYSVDRLIASGFGIHLGAKNAIQRLSETLGLIPKP